MTTSMYEPKKVYKVKVLHTSIIAIAIIIFFVIAGYWYFMKKPQPSRHPTFFAVYLVNGQGELDQGELRRHPEVIVTGSFNQMKEYAKWKIALWVDKNIVHKLTDEERRWFEAPPQAYYPVAVVGYGDKSTAFNILIPLNCISEAACSFLAGEAYPGFSIYQKDSNRETPNIWDG